MATQIKKETFGPLTQNADHEPAVAIQFPDGVTLAVAVSDLPEAIVQRLVVHGLSQKVGDSYASAAKEPNPLAFAKERVQTVIDQLLKGEWRVVGEGGPRVTMLARAIARATGRDLDECIEMLADKQAELDNEEKKLVDNPWKQLQKKLNSDPAVKAATAELKIEDAKAAQEAAKAAGGESTLSQLLG